MPFVTLLCTLCHVAGAFAGYAPLDTCLAPALPHAAPSYAHLVQDNCHVGWTAWEVLQVMRPVCYANYSYYTPCNYSQYPQDTHPRDGEPHGADLEWFGHTYVFRTSVKDFEDMVNSHHATWIRGVSYGTSIGFWPHSVQALLSILNAPLLGWSIDQFVVLQFRPSVHGGRSWGWLWEHFNMHKWVSQLLPLLLDCLGVSTQMGGESFYYEYTNRQTSRDPAFRAQPDRIGLGPNPSRILCFDTMIVPNNAFSKNCDHTFLDEEYHPELWRAFRSLVHRRFSIPRQTNFPIRIAVLEREKSRRLWNLQEVVDGIAQATHAKVDRITFSSKYGMDMQIRQVAKYHMMVAAHGANLMNSLFMHDHSAVIEIYTRNWSIPCYYGDIFRLHGIAHRRFCYPSGPCGYHVDHRGAEYPRDDINVDVKALVKVVLEELEKVKIRMTRARLKSRKRPLYHTQRRRGPAGNISLIGQEGVLHPDRTSGVTLL